MARDDFRDLYQSLLLDHSRERHGFGLREPAGAESHQRNRSCGDDLIVRVHLGESAIDTVSWEGQGCSISQASASILSDLMAGASSDRVEHTVAAFRAMLHSRGTDEGSEELLGDAVALSGVSKYPQRVKCAMLAWVALEEALAQLPGWASPTTVGSAATGSAAMGSATGELAAAEPATTENTQ